MRWEGTGMYNEARVAKSEGRSREWATATISEMILYGDPRPKMRYWWMLKAWRG